MLDRDTAMQIKGAILDRVLQPKVGETIRADADPMDPMNTDDATGRAARFFLGDDIVMKFNACFLKPARTGSSTPWHQDNGLWRDGGSATC